MEKNITKIKEIVWSLFADYKQKKELNSVFEKGDK
jgi:hypothetical protein